ncbi:cytochrome c1 [Thalassotalea agarivorans]|uniref:Ubiquinol-cytochrome c reductase cytochrome c1 subunit n=1 Tax=Thalassotalea agarivorans TaxID=349064 RepID=A0A1I0AXZ8_THASX|nr:cytochrome c1 [Thalassotalea agarivorans]SES99280.1 ubiquinol-cytochrome c reductase cytochrome c1 subunit [Thalassotalea agarivorans]
MKKLLLAVLACVPLVALAAGPSAPTDKANNDLADKDSLKRGFEAYMNYCLGCHSLQYQRYNRTFEDLGIDEEEGKAKFMYTGSKVGDHIKNAMPAADGAKWFGSTPPDLTLEARFRGTDWIYTYLRTFYVDESRPFGVNNVIFKDVGMPHVLQSLQGVQVLTDEAKAMLALPQEEQRPLTSADLIIVQEGSMSPEDYDLMARDIANFLEYTGEPGKLARERLGYWVIGFLVILFILSYLLKKEYWRDIH